MNELIKINYDTEQPTVSARDLHNGLKIRSNFTTWFDRMAEYDFKEGTDFFTKWSDSKNGNAVNFEKSSQYMSSKGYVMEADITVDMAKQICMIQRTPQGKQYRQYFLDLEKAWDTPEQIMARALKFAVSSIDSLKERCGRNSGLFPIRIPVRVTDRRKGEAGCQAHSQFCKEAFYDAEESERRCGQELLCRCGKWG